MELPKCDKCGQPVPPVNDARIIQWIKSGRKGYLLVMARHFLPVPGCEGSPSRAQYIKGQPKSERYPYDQAQESGWRKAYKEALRKYGSDS